MTATRGDLLRYSKNKYDLKKKRKEYGQILGEHLKIKLQKDIKDLESKVSLFEKSFNYL